MKRLEGALIVGLALLAAPTVAAEGPAVTVLLHHPNDGVDPFGFAFQGADGFTARYGQFADANGRFVYPFFVADGAIPIAALPDPDRPFDSVRQAYGQAVDVRRLEESPLSLSLSSNRSGNQISVTLTVESTTNLESEDLHLWAAVAEDPVTYTPPTGLTNGITEHRFTVRALVDLGRVEWVGGEAEATWTVRSSGWEPDRLLIAAWVQQEAASGRFDAREIVQATHAALGDSVQQVAKGVLVEVLSATWCDPCLYGDLAAEDLAITLGSAERLEAPRTRYFQPPANAWAVVSLSLAFGLAVALGGRRVPP